VWNGGAFETRHDLVKIGLALDAADYEMGVVQSGIVEAASLISSVAGLHYLLRDAEVRADKQVAEGGAIFVNLVHDSLLSLGFRTLTLYGRGGGMSSRFFQISRITTPANSALYILSHPIAGLAEQEKQAQATGRHHQGQQDQPDHPGQAKEVSQPGLIAGAIPELPAA